MSKSRCTDCNHLTSIVGIIKLSHQGRDVIAQGVIYCFDVFLPQFWKIADIISAQDVPIARNIWKVSCITAEVSTFQVIAPVSHLNLQITAHFASVICISIDNHKCQQESMPMGRWCSRCTREKWSDKFRSIFSCAFCLPIIAGIFARK